MFLAYTAALLTLLERLKALSGINASIQRGLAAAESIFGMLDLEDEPDNGTVRLERARGELRFDRVSLKYAGSERDALTDVSLTIRPGETVALVGSSGSGKTSLVNLIPRFYEPSAGRLFVDGHDITTLTLASLRAQIALVSQDVLLFDDTIAANIAYGAMAGASRADVERAAAAANALEFIRATPQGFDTRVGENGMRLSGGQRQRLAIARAILKDAPILILDEATSSLDSESERQVQAALDTLMQGRTTIVIAHRLSTIEHADRIVVLDAGRIVEQGTHADADRARRHLRAPAPAPVRGGRPVRGRRLDTALPSLAHESRDGRDATRARSSSPIPSRRMAGAARRSASSPRPRACRRAGTASSSTARTARASSPRRRASACRPSRWPIGRKRPAGVIAMRRALHAAPFDVVNTHSSTDTWLAALALRTGRSARAACSCARATFPSRCRTIAATRWLYRKATRTTRHDRRGAARDADPRQRHRPRTDRFDSHRHRRARASRPATGRAARAALGLPADAPLIGIVATLRSWKGHRYLLEAFARLAQPRRAPRHRRRRAAARGARGAGRRARRCATASSSPGSRTTSRRGCARSTCSRCRRMRTKACRRRCCRRCSRGVPCVTTDAGAIPEIARDGETALVVAQGGCRGARRRPRRAARRCRDARKRSRPTRARIRGAALRPRPPCSTAWRRCSAARLADAGPP